MRSSLLASVDVITFQTAEVHSNLDLSNVKYSTYKQSEEENLKVMERIKPNNNNNNNKAPRQTGCVGRGGMASRIINLRTRLNERWGKRPGHLNPRGSSPSFSRLASEPGWIWGRWKAPATVGNRYALVLPVADRHSDRAAVGHQSQPSASRGINNTLIISTWARDLKRLRSSIFWDITPCSPLKVNRRFVGILCLHL
jgi:hypothetical protein